MSRPENELTIAAGPPKKLVRRRVAVLDSLRGATLVSMVLYHACWDLVYLFGVNWSWYRSHGAFVWQQSICWTFILLSGFCWPLSRQPLRRGAVTFGCGLAVTAVTLVFSPQSRVVFGVLTLLGSCMMLQALLQRLCERVPAGLGLGLSLALFAATRWVNRGYLWFGALGNAALPQTLYQGLGATYLGFTDPTFYSSDYFSLLPWYFLFAAGYYAHRLWFRTLRKSPLAAVRLPGLDWLGRHSLVVYMLHQPLIFALLTGWDRFLR